MLDWVQSWPLASIQLPIDLMAAAVFAVTGALVASRKQMDIVGFLWLGVVTGSWRAALCAICSSENLFSGSVIPRPSMACIVASLAVYFTAHHHIFAGIERSLWLDALGLALVTIAGTAKGARFRNGAHS